MTVPSTTHNLNGFLKNVVSRTKGAKSALSTLIISRLWNFSIELKPSQFHLCFGSQGYILKLIANHQYCLESSSLKSYKTTVFSHVNVLSRIANGSHCVFLRGFFLNDPITKFSFEFFFTTEYIMNCWTENEAKKQQLVTGGSKRLLTPWAFFPSTLMMFLTVFISLIINAWYVCCKYKTMFHFYIERTCVPSSSFGGRCIRCTNSSTCRAFSILVKVFLN